MTDDDEDEDLPEAVSPENPAEDNVSPKAYRAKQRELDIRDGERAQFWSAVLASDIGRREMWGVLADAHAFEDRFAVGPTGFPDRDRTFFERGSQAFGHRIFLTLLKYAREGAIRMLEEHDVRLAPNPPRRRRRVNG